MPRDRSKDRRVQKTQALLHGALASLIHEKSYDAIVVKEILARANVGRSTFYTHFRDKDELLESGIRDVLRAGDRTSPERTTAFADRVLRFSLPVFEHIERYRSAGDSSGDAQGQAVVHEHLERVLVELIAKELRSADRLMRKAGGTTIPCDLLARYVASAFLLVLNWWLDSDEPLAPRRADEVFRALVIPTLTAVLNCQVQ
jgi:AcrR family transcriptional regulator